MTGYKFKTSDNTFYGNKISAYGIENHRVDYETLGNTGNKVLCTGIPDIDPSIWENIEHGSLWDEDGEPIEIYQYYLIDERLKSILEEWTDEIILYSEMLGAYVWGIPFWGTSWDYVLTDIEIEEE